LVGGLSLPAYAASDKEAFSDAVWRNGKYDSTLGDMAGRKLYVYGIVDSFAGIPEGGTDADVYLISDDTATRLDTALYLYRICGSEPENECLFSDVPEEYTEAVAWLYEAGVTKGVGNNLYGVGSITEYQLLVMLSRYFGWESESYDAVFYLADSLGLLPLGPEDDAFTYGELYQILSAMIDRLVPERAVPVRPEMSIPESIALTADSYREADRQIRTALQYLPGTITVQFSEDCPQEDLELFEQHYDWFYGDKELPIIGALNRSYVSPYFLTSYSNGRYKLWMSHYCDAYQAYSDSLNWLRVYEDTSYSVALTEFTAKYLAPIKSVSSQYDRIVKAHDLLCSLAAFTIKLTPSEFLYTITRPRVLSGYRVSILTALAAASVNAVMGLIMAWVLVRYEFPGKKLIDGIIEHAPAQLCALAAGNTAANILVPDVTDFGINTFRFKGLCKLIDGDSRVAV